MKIKVHTQILLALVFGAVVGWGVLRLGYAPSIFDDVGTLFIRLLKMIIVPLIFSTMVSGVVSIGKFGQLGKIGLQTFTYYLITTVLAIAVGLVFVNLIRPGVGAELPTSKTFSAEEHTPPSVKSILTDIVPVNIFEAMASGDVISVIFFSLLFGTALLACREKARPVVEFFTGFDAVMMKLTGWIMNLAPIGVFALIAAMMIKLNIKTAADFQEKLWPYAKYIGTVLLGLGIHGCVTLPLLLSILARRNPLVFFRDMLNALVTAYSTASSAATLPISMECLEENAKVPNRITSFVMPIGATVNMDGTALYEAVAAMFIAQAYGVHMTFANQLIIVLTATLASIGAAAIPSAGLITMVIVLKAVGLPLEGIGIIWGVDRLLDMFRTAVNVWGDSCGAAIVANMNNPAK